MSISSASSREINCPVPPGSIGYVPYESQDWVAYWDIPPGWTSVPHLLRPTGEEDLRNVHELYFWYKFVWYNCGMRTISDSEARRSHCECVVVSYLIFTHVKSCHVPSAIVTGADFLQEHYHVSSSSDHIVYPETLLSVCNRPTNIPHSPPSVVLPEPRVIFLYFPTKHRLCCIISAAK